MVFNFWHLYVDIKIEKCLFNLANSFLNSWKLKHRKSGIFVHPPNKVRIYSRHLHLSNGSMSSSHNLHQFVLSGPECSEIVSVFEGIPT